MTARDGTTAALGYRVVRVKKADCTASDTFFCFTHVHYIPIVSVGKDWRIETGPWRNLKRQHPFLKLHS